MPRVVTMTSGRSGESPDDFSLPGPNSARVYDYFLGGVNNFGVDRAFAKQVVGLVPEIAAATRLNRRFIHRAVRYLVEQGVSQFLEIGCGTPTFGMVHEVAQAIEPGARVVYVDSESVAVAHAELRLRQGVAGTGVLRADLCEPDEILGSDTVQQLRSADMACALTSVPSLFVASRQAFADPAVLGVLPPNWHRAQVVGAGHFVQMDVAAGYLVGRQFQRHVPQ